MSKNVGSIGVKLSTGLSKKMPARVRDIARPRQTENATRDLRGPRRTSDVLLDTAVDGNRVPSYRRFVQCRISC